MPLVRIEHAVPDYEGWKHAFDRDPADRRGSGVRRYQVLRALDDPNYVMIELEFETEAAATGFIEKMRRIWDGPGRAVMRDPHARVFERVEAVEL
jgi:hypothetical protein